MTLLLSFCDVHENPRDDSQDVSYGEIQKYYGLKAKSQVDLRKKTTLETSRVKVDEFQFWFLSENGQ